MKSKSGPLLRLSGRGGVFASEVGLFCLLVSTVPSCASTADVGVCAMRSAQPVLVQSAPTPSLPCPDLCPDLLQTLSRLV